jgi:dephospho-CoA kinase
MAARLMLKVALTGGIGTGKSVVRARFEARGVLAIDADAVVHEALGAGTAVTARVAECFGPAILTADGAVNRPKLASLVFADEEARRALEALVHPHVFAVILDWFAGLAERGTTGWALADIPLLFETRRERWFDKVIVAACDPDEQVRRVMARDGSQEADVRARLNAQWPIGDKVARADFVVWTDRGFDETDRQVAAIYRALMPGAPPSP